MIDSQEVDKLPLPLQRNVSGMRQISDDELLTIGRDCLIKRWQLRPLETVSRLRTGDAPAIAFDLREPNALWAATADGRLTVYDVETAQAICHVDAHNDPVECLAIGARRDTVATCAGNRIRLWRREGKEIVRIGELTAERPVRSLALSPAGDRLATYDADDRVALWDVSSRRLLARQSMRETGPGVAVGGIVSFSADGTLLAAAGPGQSTWLLDGRSLAIVHRPSIAAGRGATALAWQPGAENVLFGGDTIGRVHGYPTELRRALLSKLLGRTLGNVRIAGIAFTPEGSRLAAATIDGQLLIADPTWIGPTMLTHVETPDAGRVRQVAFNAQGRNLAIAFEQGVVEIWKSEPSIEPTGDEPERSWQEVPLLQLTDAADLALRPESIAVDEDGGVHVLHVRKDRTSDEHVVALAHETSSGPRQEVLARFHELRDRDVDSLHRSLALVIDQSGWAATLRRPDLATTSVRGELVLLRGDFAAPRRNGEHVITDFGNHGFDTFLASADPSRLDILHFSHSGHYLLHTSGTIADPRTVAVARQGDGFNLRGAVDRAGRLHAIFGACRYNGERFALWYVVIDSATGEQIERNVVDPSCAAVPYGLVIDAQGIPTALYTRWQLDDSLELRLARRTDDGWSSEPVLPTLLRYTSVSNLASLPDGTLRFAYYHYPSDTLALVTHRAGRRTTEHIQHTIPSEGPLGESAPWTQVTVLTDHAQNPLIVVARRFANSGSLHVLRPLPPQ